ncbi:hypothetical protein D3C85_1522070 [compost metagenome]
MLLNIVLDAASNGLKVVIHSAVASYGLVDIGQNGHLIGYGIDGLVGEVLARELLRDVGDRILEQCPVFLVIPFNKIVKVIDLQYVQEQRLIEMDRDVKIGIRIFFGWRYNFGS